MQLLEQRKPEILDQEAGRDNAGAAQGPVNTPASNIEVKVSNDQNKEHYQIRRLVYLSEPAFWSVSSWMKERQWVKLESFLLFDGD